MLESTAKLTVIALVSLSLLLGGCVRHVVQYDAANAPGKFQVGDRILVSLNSGQKFTAVFASATRTTLFTKGGNYAWSDIRWVSRDEVDVGRSVLAGLGGAAAWYAISVALVALFIHAITDSD